MPGPPGLSHPSLPVHSRTPACVFGPVCIFHICCPGQFPPSVKSFSSSYKSNGGNKHTKQNPHSSSSWIYVGWEWREEKLIQFGKTFNSLSLCGLTPVLTPVLGTGMLQVSFLSEQCSLVKLSLFLCSKIDFYFNGEALWGLPPQLLMSM